MRRASLLILVAMISFGAACDEGEGAAPPPPSRVVAVAASDQGPDLEGFCDVRPEGRFHFPDLAGPTPSLTGPTWVNVWATWCRPCVEEIPLIGEMMETLRAGNVDASVVFLNADAEPEAVSHYREAHPSIPRGPRIADSEALPTFLSELGLDEGAGLPVHIFLAGDGKTRCVRSGAITEDHRRAVAALLSE